MNTELIQLKGVVKSFKKNLVLDSISLSIPEGKITGIIGASGEGKSTILKLLIGFYRPTSGEVLYLKRNVQDDIKMINKTFGFATEDGSFYSELGVLENLHHFGRLYKMKEDDVKRRAKELVDFVGLENAERTKAKDLSVGMKKRLDVACSMIHKPDVLIMDEPTADLDPLLREQILSLITAINKEGTTIIITTQLLEEMDRICDKIAILRDKKIIEEGEPTAIRAKYKASSLNEVFQQIFIKSSRKKESEVVKKESFKDKIEGVFKKKKEKKDDVVKALPARAERSDVKQEDNEDDSAGENYWRGRMNEDNHSDVNGEEEEK